MSQIKKRRHNWTRIRYVKFYQRCGYFLWKCLPSWLLNEVRSALRFTVIHWAGYYLGFIPLFRWCNFLKNIFLHSAKLDRFRDHVWTINPSLNSYVESWTYRYITKCAIKHLLDPYSRVLLQKLTSSQLVKKFPAVYGIPSFITPFTTARHLSLS